VDRCAAPGSRRAPFTPGVAQRVWPGAYSRLVFGTEDVIGQLDSLLDAYQPMLAFGDMGYGPYLKGKSHEQGTAYARLASAIARLAPPGSSYRQEADRIDASGNNYDRRGAMLLGIVRGLREDYAAGYTQSVEELIHADLFTDFLDMAKELLDKGYKDAAAVIAGSTLEGHLRQLATKHSISVTKPDGKAEKAEAINTALGKTAYGTAEQKNVTAWLGLRNDAAHGKYDEYDRPQVALLIDSVRAFTVRLPA
jgi:hypothetical protein